MSADLDADLKQGQKKYLIAAAVFALLTVTAIVLHKYDIGCLATFKSLQSAKNNLRKMRDANNAIDTTLKQLNALFPPERSKLSGEQLLYSRIDDIKLRFRGADISMGTIENQSGYLGINFGLKGSLQNFPAFLDALGDLERTVLPTVQIKTLNISQQEIQQFQTVAYQIDGVLKFPLPADATPQQ